MLSKKRSIKYNLKDKLNNFLNCAAQQIINESSKINSMNYGFRKLVPSTYNFQLKYLETELKQNIYIIEYN